MRIAIREQLALLVLTAVLVALAVVSVPTWLYVNGHIARNLRSGLALTASLKASRITSLLGLLESTSYTMGSRLLIQDALTTFYTLGSTDWSGASIDITSALNVGATTGLLQARIYSRNTTGPVTGLLNVTGTNVPEIVLPYTTEDGSRVTLSDTEHGYPPDLYPNITYVDLDRGNRIRPDIPATVAEAFPGVRISSEGGLVLGPMILNESAALLSVSVPIRDNGDNFILGYMTVVAMATSIIEVRDSREGLDRSGMVLIIGPTDRSNRFNLTLPASNATYTPPKQKFGEVDVRFVLPPCGDHAAQDRHSERKLPRGLGYDPFPVKDYPAVLDALVSQTNTVNNASSMLHTRNEQGADVSVGFARTQTPLVNWTIVVEKSKAEAYEPINTLSDILLGTVFGTAGLLAVIIFPCAHIGVMPIRKLKAATEKSVNPPGYDDSLTDSEYDDETPGSAVSASPGSHRSKKRIAATISRLMGRKPPKRDIDRDRARRLFKIPGKVDVGKHFIKDELTELTRTFNDMSDELVKQYTSLDDKVAERTKQLNESKKAAEAANESKTLFIANISHELKTPLNGILGLCAVCMEETDIARIKQSLKVVYGSGDLLLHLLEDLLSFSKNQIGHQVIVEPRAFRLADIRSQILAIFDKQVNQGQIDFSVTFPSTFDVPERDRPPSQSDLDAKLSGDLQRAPKLEDLLVWGDQHRILQVIINLVSNSLKFTPPHGKVEVRMRCLGEDPSASQEEGSRTSSLSLTQSKASRTGGARRRTGGASSSVQSSYSGPAGANSTPNPGHTALSINPMEAKATPLYQPSPPEGIGMGPLPGAKSFIFEFEVQDTGPGIPPRLQDKVFEPFVQGDPGLSKKFGGTGLGLSICQQLAGLMGGSIVLKSVEGSGSTFTMHIPLKFAAASRLASEQSVSGSGASPDDVARGSGGSVHSIGSRSPLGSYGTAMSPNRDTSEEGHPSNALDAQPRLVGLRQPYFSVDVPGPESSTMRPSPLERKDSQKKLRVLVADDNSTNIEVVSRMLKLEDVSDVTIAKDGQEAYELVKDTMATDEQFDVIFMDVQMPNVNGLQSTRLIRKIGYTSPIIALTAFSEESNVKDCIDSGMDEFLSKPIRRPALKQVLKRFATIPEEPESPTSATRRMPPTQAGAPPAAEKDSSNPNYDPTELPPSPPPTTSAEDDMFEGLGSNEKGP